MATIPAATHSAKSQPYYSPGAELRNVPFCVKLQPSSASSPVHNFIGSQSENIETTFSITASQPGVSEVLPLSVSAQFTGGMMWLRVVDVSTGAQQFSQMPVVSDPPSSISLSVPGKSLTVGAVIQPASAEGPVSLLTYLEVPAQSWAAVFIRLVHPISGAGVFLPYYYEFESAVPADNQPQFSPMSIAGRALLKKNVLKKPVSEIKPVVILLCPVVSSDVAKP